MDKVIERLGSFHFETLRAVHTATCDLPNNPKLIAHTILPGAAPGGKES